jgi:hypothetical protein
MDPINTTPTNDDNKIIADETIEEAMPLGEDGQPLKKPLSETEVEEVVGGDAPVDGAENMNNEDEEAEKSEPTI